MTIGMLGAPASAWAGDVVGKVYDAQGRAAAAVEVTLAGQDRVTLTAADGTFSFTDVAAGEQQLTITLANETFQRVWLDVAEDGESRRNIFLMSPVIMSSAIMSSAIMSSALGIAAPPELADQAFAQRVEQALELAEQMRRDGAERETAEWRWRDLDA